MESPLLFDRAEWRYLQNSELAHVVWELWSTSRHEDRRLW
jgi:hypothetical protein